MLDLFDAIDMARNFFTQWLVDHPGMPGLDLFWWLRK